MSEQRSPRVGDDVEVRIPRARIAATPDDRWFWLKDADGRPLGRVRAEHVSVLSSPPQPGDRIKNLGQLAECVRAEGLIYIPDDPEAPIGIVNAGQWCWSHMPTRAPVELTPGRVLAVRGEQR